MPYKNVEDRKVRDRKFYAQNKDRWKNPDGTWKKTNYSVEERKAIVNKSYAKNKARRAITRKAKQPELRVKRYGLSLVEYEQLLEKQNGLCAVCNKEKPTAIDHNHKTDEVRGLLCQHCNLMIGFSKESMEILQNAIEYLRGYQA